MGSVMTGADLGGHEPESSLPNVELRPGDRFLRADPFDCQTAGLLTANAIAPKGMELAVGGILPSGRFLELGEAELIHLAGFPTPQLWLSWTLTAIVSFPVSKPFESGSDLWRICVSPTLEKTGLRACESSSHGGSRRLESFAAQSLTAIAHHGVAAAVPGNALVAAPARQGQRITDRPEIR